MTEKQLKQIIKNHENKLNELGKLLRALGLDSECEKLIIHLKINKVD